MSALLKIKATLTIQAQGRTLARNVLIQTQLCAILALGLQFKTDVHNHSLLNRMESAGVVTPIST